MTHADFQASAKRTIAQEVEAINTLSLRIDETFTKACETILACRGRVVVTGMGKSGHIGGKIAATLASTGTPSFFIHPGDASHGDLGMITGSDVVIAISNSGGAHEIITLLPILRRLNVPLISMTGKPNSTIAKEALVNLSVGVDHEACPLDLAPTSSTTVTLVMGDALAVALLEARGFTTEDFALSHPGGTLGRRLLLTVADVMRAGDEVPKTGENASMTEALAVMTAKGLGMTTVVNDANELLGIFTDGDLRRAVDNGHDIKQTTIANIMSQQPQTVSKESLATNALMLMEQKKITTLVVTNDTNNPIGVLHMHDLLRAGIL